MVDGDSKLRFSFLIQKDLHLKPFRKVLPLIFLKSSPIVVHCIFSVVNGVCLFPLPSFLVDVQSVRYLDIIKIALLSLSDTLFFAVLLVFLGIKGIEVGLKCCQNLGAFSHHSLPGGL